MGRGKTTPRTHPMQILKSSPEPCLTLEPAKAGQGSGLMCKWHGCDFSLLPLKKAASLLLLCMNAATDSGLQVMREVFHQFNPYGATGTVLLAESEKAIHTWSNEKFFTMSAYVCNYMQVNAQKALKLLAALKTMFKPPQESLIQAPVGLNHV